MNNEENQRGNMQNPGMRKPMSTNKFSEKKPNYSPSTSYNYSPQTGHTGGMAQMNARRRPDNFRREAPNSSDRILRQNDIIIKLLKEIRDRLPEPANYEKSEAAPDDAVEAIDGEGAPQDLVSGASDETQEPDEKNA